VPVALLNYGGTGTMQNNAKVAVLVKSGGVVGPQGPQGWQGAMGPQGFQGVQGATGTQGTTGAQGAQGTQGVQGATGSQGTTGVGTQGPQGPAGNQGPQGAGGTQGPQGNQGASVTGPQGAGFVIVAATAPSTASTQAGAVWWDTDNGRAYLLYDDGNSKQWVEFIGSAGAQGAQGVPGGISNLVAGSTGPIAQANATGTFLEVRGAGAAGDAAYMKFSRPGSYASMFGIDIDNQWKVGGGNAGAVAQSLLHAGNSFSLAGGNLNAGSRNITTTGGVQASVVTSKSFQQIIYDEYGIVGGGTVTINPADGQTQQLVLIGAITINILADNMSTGSILRLNISGADNPITWPSNVYWPMGVVPELGVGPLKWGLVVLQKIDGPSLIANGVAY
jgi:hypothetical protein